MKGLVTDKPRFFKVILETTISNKLLMLPPTFVERHYLKSVSTNPTTATLTIPSGLTWKVDVVVNTSTTTTNAGPEVWFQGEGWDKFVTSHSLEHGHFIVFQYDGSSNFSVLVFDTSCSEIDYISTKKKPEEAKTKEDADQFEDRNDDDVSVEEIIPNMEMSAKCATEKANQKRKESSSRGGFRETKREEEEEDDDDVSILPEFGFLSKSVKRSL
ncbi:B3 domain-containing protein At4g01580 [Linum grandiflorum]